MPDELTNARFRAVGRSVRADHVCSGEFGALARYGLERYVQEMSVSAAHASVFFSEAVSGAAVWSITDDGGQPAPINGDGKRSMPFWSKEPRAESVVRQVGAYQDFKVVRIGLGEWTSRWLPGLAADGLLVGLNWSGARATGFDVEPADVLQRLAVAADKANGSPPNSGVGASQRPRAWELTPQDTVAGTLDLMKSVRAMLRNPLEQIENPDVESYFEALDAWMTDARRSQWDERVANRPVSSGEWDSVRRLFDDLQLRCSGLGHGAATLDSLLSLVDEQALSAMESDELWLATNALLAALYYE